MSDDSSLINQLTDRYGRKVTYLRLSVTDRCDFRCHYCMAEEMTFLPRAEVLTLEECLRLARVCTELGVNKIRITGGEPLVRRNVLWLLERIAALPGLRELTLTTNGSQLERYAAALKQAGVARLNVSLDTLDAGRFHSLTRVGNLERVLAGLAAAYAAGFAAIKLNTVMMRGFNDDELGALAQFAIERGFDISFIEEMPLGEVGHARRDTYYSAADALAGLQPRFALLPSTESSGGPARYWRVPHSPTRIGFIAPHSHNFCADCNRVRVTCTGELYPCLGQNEKIDLRTPLRTGVDDTPLKQALMQAMNIKPQGHDFDVRTAKPQVMRFMSVTGG
ncbi:MAG: GTP 3',8-cyclase MoaA [Pseudomonadota bacterium]